MHLLAPHIQGSSPFAAAPCPESISLSSPARANLRLVQVEDQQKGGEDPVARVPDKLIQAGVAPARIKSHTSGLALTGE
jgi:hypothetical protein